MESPQINPLTHQGLRAQVTSHRSQVCVQWPESFQAPFLVKRGERRYSLQRLLYLPILSTPTPGLKEGLLEL